MRNPVFDIMKGFGILLVIAGHWGGVNKYLFNFIFSFHMPLFFILAGYFYKPKDTSDSLSKDFKRLIIPYLFTCSLILFYKLALFIHNHDKTPLLRSLAASFWKWLKQPFLSLFCRYTFHWGYLVFACSILVQKHL